MNAMTLWTLSLAMGAFGGTIASNPSLQERPPFPTEFGVNIHFTKPVPGEMDLLQKMGCQVVRMDFAWARIETVKGQYDFREYDGLVAELERAKIRPYFILDYGNAYYQTGGLTDPTAQDAFARFAGAAVKRFKGKGIVWEIWNEPNILPFWSPKPDVEAYIQLAKKTVREIRKNDPKAWIVGPATSGFDWEFLESVFASGLLEDFDAISVHPYRPGPPESAWEDYAKLDSMMEFFGRRRPILSGEWGYSTFSRGVSEQRQASYLARMWAINAAAKLPVSIFYDWRDDGPNPEEVEHRFGVVRQGFEPKPSYSAARDWIETTKKWKVLRRLEDSGGEVALLLESKSGRGLAVLSWNPSSDILPTLRETPPEEAERLRTRLSDLWGTDDARISKEQAALKGLKPFDVAYQPRVQASYGPAPRSLWSCTTPVWTVHNRSILNLTLLKPDGSTVAMPTQSLEIVASSQSPKVEVPRRKAPLEFGGPEKWATVVTESRNWISVPYAENAPQATKPVAVNAGVDFDKEIHWDYKFEKGWQYAGIDPAIKEISPGAKAAVVWVRLDGSGNFLRSRIKDSTGRIFQMNLGTLGDAGSAPRWMPVRIPLDGSEVAASWGGNGSSDQPRGPLTWSHMLLVDSAFRSNPKSGTLRIGAVSYQF